MTLIYYVLQQPYSNRVLCVDRLWRDFDVANDDEIEVFTCMVKARRRQAMWPGTAIFPWEHEIDDTSEARCVEAMRESPAPPLNSDPETAPSLTSYGLF